MRLLRRFAPRNDILGLYGPEFDLGNTPWTLDISDNQARPTDWWSVDSHLLTAANLLKVSIVFIEK